MASQTEYERGYLAGVNGMRRAAAMGILSIECKPNKEKEDEE